MRSMLASVLLACCATAFAATATAPAASTTPDSVAAVSGGGSNQVVVSGTVPDDATKAEILEKVRALYGANRVVDQLSVGGVVTPANWGHFVTRMLGPNLKDVSHGAVSIRGTTISIRGDVANEATRQQVLSGLSQSFDSHYAIKPALKIVATASKQTVLNQTLANRTVQFQSGSAVLTPAGTAILDQMAAAIKQINDPFIQIVGNTDNVGNHDANVLLSLQRAEAVKAYLVGQGIPAASLAVSGQGPDNPIASNDTDAGRARNRRIDFKVSKQ